MGANRLTYRRRLSYNTKSNRKRVSKTPGGKLVYLYPKKPAKVPICGGQCRRKLRGIIPLRPLKLMSVSKRHKTVTRSYGGTLCGQCLRERIIRAFLIEEQKIVLHTMKAKAAQK